MDVEALSVQLGGVLSVCAPRGMHLPSARRGRMLRSTTTAGGGQRLVTTGDHAGTARDVGRRARPQAHHVGPFRAMPPRTVRAFSPRISEIPISCPLGLELGLATRRGYALGAASSSFNQFVGPASDRTQRGAPRSRRQPNPELLSWPRWPATLAPPKSWGGEIGG